MLENSLRQALIILNILFCSGLQAYDLTVIGIINYADGLGKIPIGLIDTLKNDLKINFIPVGEIDDSHVNEETRRILFDSDKTPGKVSILTAPLFWSSDGLFYKSVPESAIKIAYSMFESTRIPSKWVKVLNAKFDAVVVPDSYLVQIYKNSGVNIPIFVLPIGMYLDDFLQQEEHPLPSVPFVFGASAAFSPHKNLALIIQAFAAEFGHSKEAILKLHGRLGIIEPFQNLINNLGVSNVIFSTGRINQEEYMALINSFDCYINLSKGEGFSLCPREALALGIPCILSNNTAQKTICRSGFVKSVPSKVKESAHYGLPYFDSQSLGYQFNCHLGDVRKALRNVYAHYKYYLKLAQLGRQWVTQYSWIHLKSRYLNLVQPKEIILGKNNVVTDNYLMTNSKTLYDKYKNMNKE